MATAEYEVTFIVNPTLSEDDTVGVAERVTQAITTRGGTVTEITPWGRRRLAYPINHLREGAYVTIAFTMETDREAEIEGAINLIEPVIRHLVVRLDERKRAREQRARQAAQRAAQQAAAAASSAGAPVAVAEPPAAADLDLDLDLPDDEIPPAVAEDLDADEEV